MNIKIQTSGVSSLVGAEYEQVYAALRKQLGDGIENPFAERIPGYDYLQWVLPGDGWRPLSDADADTVLWAREELSRRQQNAIALFGNNQALAKKVLTMPDESFIFYRINEAGQIEIKMTAWGYRYPERLLSNGAYGQRMQQPPIPPVAPVTEVTPPPYIAAPAQAEATPGKSGGSNWLTILLILLLLIVTAAAFLGGWSLLFGFPF